jgi:holo-ACP synthase CitX
MDIRNIRENILAAKEKRAFLRKHSSGQGKASLSLSLNIPGYPKRSPLFTAFFDRVLSELKQYLLARRILLDTAHEIDSADEAGEFYLASLAEGTSLTQIKTLCEDFEEGHPVGRAIDIDLTDTQGNPISSGKLKQCFLCDRPHCLHARAASFLSELA